jgi:hypothetical protein
MGYKFFYNINGQPYDCKDCKGKGYVRHQCGGNCGGNCGGKCTCKNRCK